MYFVIWQDVVRLLLVAAGSLLILVIGSISWQLMRASLRYGKNESDH